MIIPRQRRLIHDNQVSVAGLKTIKCGKGRESASFDSEAQLSSVSSSSETTQMLLLLLLLLLQLRMWFFADDYGRKLRIPQVQNVGNVVTVGSVGVTFGKIGSKFSNNKSGFMCLICQDVKMQWGGRYRSCQRQAPTAHIGTLA